MSKISVKVNSVLRLPIANHMPYPVKGPLMVGEGAREIALEKPEVILDTADLVKKIDNFGLIDDIFYLAIVNSLLLESASLSKDWLPEMAKEVWMLRRVWPIATKTSNTT